MVRFIDNLVPNEMQNGFDNWPPLLTLLARVEQHANNGGDQLEASLASLLAIKEFVETNPTVTGSGLTRSLDVLANSLRDILLGGKPDLIFDRQAKPGRPSNASQSVIKAVTAACLQLLLDWQIDGVGAADIVVKSLAKSGIRYPKKGQGTAPIGAKQLKRWRHEMGGEGPPIASFIFFQILRDAKKHICSTPSREEAIGHVEGCIKGLKSRGF
jgi:hypothetical protein